MNHIASLLIIAFALSLDSASVGFTYGLRKVHIPYKSIFLITVCSMSVLLAAMGFGRFLTGILSPNIASSVGGVILIVIGVWILVQFFLGNNQEENEEKTLINIEIKALGVVIQILRRPTIADFDKSGTIVGIEAVFLGMSLSLDSFGAGLGISMLGYPPLLTAIMIAGMGAIFLMLGITIGKVLSSVGWLQRLTFIPGVLLIVIGLLKIK